MYIHGKWRSFVETIDRKTDLDKLWRTIKGIDGRAERTAENEAITFNGISFSLRQTTSHQVQTRVQHFKAGHKQFFKRIPISNNGDQEEINVDGTVIHCGPTNKSN